MKVDGKEQLPDSLENAKFTSMAWTHDNKGLFYNVRHFFFFCILLQACHSLIRNDDTFLN